MTDAPPLQILSDGAPSDYLSFFTALSNIAVVAVATCVAINVGAPLLRPVVQAGAAQYIAVTAIITFFVLGPVNPFAGAAELAASLQHIVVPLFYLGLWAVDLASGTLDRADIWKWLLFPFLYGVYTLVRGAFVGWYPYGFLSAADLGYGAVFLNLGVLGALFVLLGYATTAIDHALGRPSEVAHETSG